MKLNETLEDILGVAVLDCKLEVHQDTDRLRDGYLMHSRVLMCCKFSTKQRLDFCTNYKYGSLVLVQEQLILGSCEYRYVANLFVGKETSKILKGLLSV